MENAQTENSAAGGASELTDVLGCPFCGDQPEISSLGTCIDIDCCCSISVQKSDHLTLDERGTFNYSTYKYSDEAERKAMAVAIDIWNTRVQPNVELSGREEKL